MIFFGFIQIRDTLSTNGEHHRVAEVKSFPAIPKSMRSVNEEQNGANLKKVVSLAGLHHTTDLLAEFFAQRCTDQGKSVGIEQGAPYPLLESHPAFTFPPIPEEWAIFT